MKILVVDDHPLFNAGLVMALEHLQAEQVLPKTANLEVKSATNLEQGLAVAAAFLPDLVLLDYHLTTSSGLEALKAFADKFPWVARVVISGDGRAEVATQARAHGASGLISKTLPIEAVWEAIETIASGGEWWPSHHLKQGDTQDGVVGLLNPHPPSDDFAIDASYTLRQLEVLRLLSSGLNNRDIARILLISERTVKQHISDMLTKSGVSNRVQLLNTVRSNGVIA